MIEDHLELILYSPSQGCFHYTSVKDEINGNLRRLEIGRVVDYILCGAVWIRNSNLQPLWAELDRLKELSDQQEWHRRGVSWLKEYAAGCEYSEE